VTDPVATYWPAWVVAPALAAVTVGFWLTVRRPLGVSGVLARFTRVREELAFDRGNATLAADAAALEAAMTAATAEAFGLPPGALDAPAAAAQAEATPARSAPAGRVCAPTPSLGAHLFFLAGLAGGGLLAALARGTFGATQGLPDAFTSHVAAGPAGLAALGAGGVLVGFGTALCGGCTGGHGLTGCGRLMKGSLIASAVFFASAVAVSFLIGGRP
jgi:uncharacterized protein